MIALRTLGDKLLGQAVTGRVSLDVTSSSPEEIEQILAPYSRLLTLNELPDKVKEAIHAKKDSVIDYHEALLADRVRAYDVDVAPYRDGSKATTLRHFQAKPQQQMRSTCVNLSGYGDAFVFKVPGKDDERIIVDTALSRKDFDTLTRSMPPGRARVNVAITHQDADHLTGLSFILGAPDRFDVQEVMIGVTDESARLIVEVFDKLKSTHRRIRLPGAPNIAYFIPKARANDDSLFKVIETASSDFLLLEAAAGPGLTLQAVQMRNPATSNQSSLIVKSNHRGRTQLLTSDADEKVIEALTMSDFGGRFSLESDILKWPHHIAFPKEPSNAFGESMALFLSRVAAHTVFFSNRGPNQKVENYRAAVEFIESVLGKVQTLWTGENGHLGIVSQKDSGNRRHTGTLPRIA
jgi:beta-lactamase superfamily II metal-dependent hydrolase